MKRRRPHRPERLAALLHETLATALTTQLKDPRIGFVTITGVQVTPDGQHATVRFSVLGTDEDKARAVEALEHARGFLRSHLATHLELRLTPELRFELDRGLEHARRIDELLDGLRGEGDPA
ncbi:MAG TPA: 30S ribosome-binding factor RbfA [Gemmatimonadales bacterium]|jgi:ribosome-binding factor A